MKKICSRCRKRFPAEDLIDWLENDESLSPKFCAKCYAYILDNWDADNPDGDIESME